MADTTPHTPHTGEEDALRTATKWRVPSGHKGSVQAVAFSEDGEFLASCASFIVKVNDSGYGAFELSL